MRFFNYDRLKTRNRYSQWFSQGRQINNQYGLQVFEVAKGKYCLMKNKNGSEMKIAFSGSRRVEPTKVDCLTALFSIGPRNGEVLEDYEILVGDCPTGVDRFVYEKSEQLEGCISCSTYHADWDQHGKAAGPIRNQAMINDADALAAFPCPQSKGTWDAIRKAVKKGIPVVIIPLTEQ